VFDRGYFQQLSLSASESFDDGADLQQSSNITYDESVATLSVHLPL
jgi:hypothetical protein